MNAPESPPRRSFGQFVVVTFGVALLALPFFVLLGSFWLRVGASP